MAQSYPVLNADLTRVRWMPSIPLNRVTAGLIRRIPGPTAAPPDDIAIEEITVLGTPDGPPVGLRVYRPRTLVEPAPALFWIHGGGFVLGRPEQDEPRSMAIAGELGITVVALRYRLAPQHPYPAPLDDAYAGLRWLFAQGDHRGVDPQRIAIGGASAGGGLAAGLVLMAHDRGEVQPAFQALTYPMLDDRTVLRRDLDAMPVRMWTPNNNRYGWSSYLGGPPGGLGVPDYAAPARRADLSGLPPAWIGVGDLDLFHDEDVRYAERLQASGVPCRLHVAPGAFHGFDAVFAKASVTQDFFAAQVAALRSALLPAFAS